MSEIRMSDFMVYDLGSANLSALKAEQSRRVSQDGQTRYLLVPSGEWDRLRGLPSWTDWRTVRVSAWAIMTAGNPFMRDLARLGWANVRTVSVS